MSRCRPCAQRHGQPHPRPTSATPGHCVVTADSGPERGLARTAWVQVSALRFPVPKCQQIPVPSRADKGASFHCCCRLPAAAPSPPGFPSHPAFVSGVQAKPEDRYRLGAEHGQEW